MICLDAASDRSLVRAAIGDLLRIELPENVAAGSRWALPDPLPPQLRLVLDKMASGAHVAYADGARRLEFRVVAEGTCSLSLVSSQGSLESSTIFQLFIETLAGAPPR